MGNLRFSGHRQPLQSPMLVEIDCEFCLTNIHMESSDKYIDVKIHES